MIPKHLKRELINLCYIQSHSKNEKRMVLYLVEQLKLLGLSYTIDAVGNILVVKGKSKTYPCIVSHMDTVHFIVSDYTVYSQEIEQNDTKLYAKSKNKLTGIGGDDKCGVFACLYFLKLLPNVKVVFFTQEEAGLKGSNNIEMSFFDDVRYIIQLDRRGAHDFIDKKWQGKTISANFASEIGHLKKKYGFKSTEGTITDVVRLWERDVSVSCLNLSCGYYAPHTKDEYIMVNELWNTILFTKDIIKNLKAKRYVRKKPKEKIVKYKYNKKIKVWCMTCKTFKSKSHGLYTQGKFVCYLCWGKDHKVNNIHNECDKCHAHKIDKKITFDPSTNQFLCDNCLKKRSRYLKCKWCKQYVFDKYGVENFYGLDFVCNECINVAGDISEAVKCDVCGKYVATAEELTIIGRNEWACISCFVEPKDEKEDNITYCDSCHHLVPKNQLEWDFKDKMWKCELCNTTPKP